MSSSDNRPTIAKNNSTITVFGWAQRRAVTDLLEPSLDQK